MVANWLMSDVLMASSDHLFVDLGEGCGVDQHLPPFGSEFQQPASRVGGVAADDEPATQPFDDGSRGGLVQTRMLPQGALVHAPVHVQGAQDGELRAGEISGPVVRRRCR
jgi:hypothetical protein